MGKKTVAQCMNCKKKPRYINSISLCKRCSRLPVDETTHDVKAREAREEIWKNIRGPTQNDIS